MRQVFTSADDMQKFAGEFVRGLQPKAAGAMIVALSGQLGAGKTTFTQGVANALGVSDTVQSPTFVIMKMYELDNRSFKHLIHIDAYRLEKSGELVHLGWSEIISDPQNLILIEWPERVADILNPDIKITLKHVSENEREVELDSGSSPE